MFIIDHAKSGNIRLDLDLKSFNIKAMIMSIKQQKPKKNQQQRIRRRDVGTTYVPKGSGSVKVAFRWWMIS